MIIQKCLYIKTELLYSTIIQAENSIHSKINQNYLASISCDAKYLSNIRFILAKFQEKNKLKWLQMLSYAHVIGSKHH